MARVFEGFRNFSGRQRNPKPDPPRHDPRASQWNAAWRKYLGSERGSDEARKTLELIRSIWR